MGGRPEVAGAALAAALLLGSCGGPEGLPEPKEPVPPAAAPIAPRPAHTGASDPIELLPDAVYQRISLKVRNETLPRTAARISKATGIDIQLANSAVKPVPAAVTLEARELPLITVLDGIATRTGLHYAVLAPDRVVFSRDYEWLDHEPCLWRAYRVDDLYVSTGKDAFLTLIEGAIRVLKHREVDYRVVARPDSGRLLLRVPESAHRRLATIFSRLRGAGDPPPAPRPPAPCGRNVWDGGEIRSYYVRGATDQVTGPTLVRAIRQRVRPDAWRDPAALLAFDSFSGRLIVIHNAEVLYEVDAFLDSLPKGDSEQ